MKTFDCDDLNTIIQKLNGGGIRPIGETRYDTEALMRQRTIQILADTLITDIYKVALCVGNEASVQTARNTAIKWFSHLMEYLKDMMQEIDERNWKEE